MATTTNFALEIPTPGGYRNTWGGTLNTTVTKLDELVAVAMPLGTIQMWPVATAPTATANGGTWLLCDGTSLSRVTYADLFALLGTAYGNVDGNTFNLPDFRARSPIGYNTATITGRSTRAIAASGGEETHALTEGELDQHKHSIANITHTHGITDVTHEHTGTTNSATANISDPGHVHTLQTSVSSWSGGGDYAATGTHIGNAQPTPNSGSSSTGISDSGHSHTFNTSSVGTGLTATNAGLTNITETGETGSNTAHNTMHPYLVVNYIILAKHPSF